MWNKDFLDVVNYLVMIYIVLSGMLVDVIFGVVNGELILFGKILLLLFDVILNKVVKYLFGYS